MKKYLKQIVQEAPDQMVTARIYAIGELQYNVNGKGFRKVTFVFPSTNVQVTEGVFDFNFRNALEGAKANDFVEIAYNKRTDFLDYRLVKADAETSQPQTQTNSAQVKGEGIASAIVKDQDVYWAKKDIGQVLGMLVKIFYKHGITFELALDHAKKARPLFMQAVEDIYDQELISSF